MIIHGFNQIIERSLAFLKDDYTELWLIVSTIVDENPELSFEGLVQATSEVISYLVSEHHLALVSDDTQKPLVMSKEEVVKAVEMHLRKLNRLPSVGNGLWMTVE